ncbi:MAG: TIM barrel protein [Nanoarchaeota archaeon]
MTIRFGPAGLGGVKEAVSNLQTYARLGLKACEIAFTYGIYIKNEEDAVKIGRKAEELDIELSIHAPYWINLNSREKRKIEESKKRILDCCKIGSLLGVSYVVFHPGYYGKMDKGETYLNIKKAVQEIIKEVKKQRWKVKLAPETTGKVNVFGSIDEIKRLVKETGCFFTLDFAHLLARSDGKESYKEMYDKFKEFKNLHCHFSGIVYGEKGERSHKLTPESELKKLLSILPRNKEITIINESPEPVGDSVKALRIYKKL